MKNARDLKHCKSVSAIALLYKGENAGRIVANWSDNPNGSVCTASVTVWIGPLAIEDKITVDLMGNDTEITQSTRTAKAGGGGYCKLSHAIGGALNIGEIQGAGIEAVRKYFEGNDYQFIEIL